MNRGPAERRVELAPSALCVAGLLFAICGAAAAGTASHAHEIVPRLVSGVGTGSALILIGTSIVQLQQRRRGEGRSIAQLERLFDERDFETNARQPDS